MDHPKYTLDAIDLRILAELQPDARLSIAKLADRVALTPTPCGRRVRLLERAGYIGGYVTLLDQRAIGLPVNAFVEVRLTRERQEEVRAFESSVRSYPEVMECWAMSGGYDYLLRVVTADLQAYNRFMRDKLLSLPSVSQVETGFGLEQVLGRTALPLDQLALLS
ncbi:MAG: Lrp/AsnC family transcriptional regulator [Rhodospirillaceae bacterium]|nr:Lrp/AsnC family transcriptional regulator [Rhodospirillaceae bacterium]